MGLRPVGMSANPGGLADASSPLATTEPPCRGAINGNAAVWCPVRGQIVDLSENGRLCGLWRPCLKGKAEKPGRVCHRSRCRIGLCL
jgi:hypothetical protein